MPSRLFLVLALAASLMAAIANVSERANIAAVAYWGWGLLFLIIYFTCKATNTDR